MSPGLLPWRRYAAYFRDRATRVTVGVFAMGARGILLALMVVFLRRIVDDAIDPGSQALLWRDGSAAVAAAILASGCALGARWTITDVTKTIVSRIRDELMEKNYRLPIDAAERAGRMLMHTIIVQDTERLDRMTNAVVGIILPAAISVALLTGALLWIAPLFGGGCALVIGLFWLWKRLADSASRRKIRAFHESFTAFSRSALAGVERIELARASAVEDVEIAEHYRAISALQRTSYDMVRHLAGVGELQELLRTLATMFLLALGGLAVSSGFIAASDMITAYLVLIIMRGQAGAIVAQTGELEEGGASLARILALLDQPEEEPYRGRRVIDFRGSLTLENVTFAYGATQLLEGVSLEVPPGRCVVLRGPNGAGKSTLFRLVLGLLRPQEGRILADGVAYEELDLVALRRQIGFVPQSPLLFDGSIKDNIAYGLPATSRDEIIEAAVLADVDGFVSRLPDGYETKIGDTGALLSGGQRQRIAFARALLRRPRLLLLDEPTNHLDPEALAVQLDRLRRRRVAPSILLISHNAAAVEVADDVFELRDGILVPELVDPVRRDILGAMP